MWLLPFPSAGGHTAVHNKVLLQHVLIIVSSQSWANGAKKHQGRSEIHKTPLKPWQMQKLFRKKREWWDWRRRLKKWTWDRERDALWKVYGCIALWTQTSLIVIPARPTIERLNCPVFVGWHFGTASKRLFSILCFCSGNSCSPKINVSPLSSCPTLVNMIFLEHLDRISPHLAQMFTPNQICSDQIFSVKGHVDFTRTWFLSCGKFIYAWPKWWAVSNVLIWCQGNCDLTKHIWVII